MFKQLPKIHPLSHEEECLIPQSERDPYPAFMKDFEVLEDLLIPHFHELNREALIHQNWHRWMYVILIFGSALLTILVIIQLAVHAESIGIIGAAIAACLGVATLVSRIFRHHERYLNARLATECLRSEYFLFLGQFEPYNNEQDRVQNLIERVTDITIEGEHYNVA